ncbi:MAG: hypothetical protein ACRDKE_10105, partial [Solirubrobacterales bacterium]
LVLSSLLLVAGVFSAQTFAHGSQHGTDGQRSAAKKIKIWNAKLTAPTEPVANVAHFGKGEQAQPTAPVGRATFAQNKNRYLLVVKVKNLTPATDYTVALYKNEDGKGSLSTANPIQDPPTIKAITTDENGFGKTWTDGPRSDFGFDTDTKYYLTVKNAAGDTVLAGDFDRKHHRWHRGCDGHGVSGSGSRSKHHH